MLTSNDAIGVRIKLAALFAVICFGLIAYRLYVVQVERHEELYEKARSQYTSSTTTHGKRGEIFDIGGNLLVGNIPCADISADPQIVGEEPWCSRASMIFSRYLGIPYKEIYEKLSEQYRVRKGSDGYPEKAKIRYTVIANLVPFQLAEEIKKKLKVNNIKGVVFKDVYKRYYTKDTLLSNILGFTTTAEGKDVPVMGMEKSLQRRIEPSDAKIVFERARDGSPLNYGMYEADHARNGYNVYLTINEPIQAILEEELDNLVAKWHPRAAYAIMIDPKTGNIMALAQRPSFNPNERKSIVPDAWRIRLTEDVFEPGSTMKPMAIAGALDYGVVTPETQFDCEKGKWFYAGKILNDSHPLTILSTAEVVQKSSNIGTAKIALRLGDQKLYKVLRDFGFGSLTGIPVKPESRGIMLPVKRWDSLSVTRYPIGQTWCVTPVQLARAYCALADGGRLRPLRLIDRIEDKDTQTTVKRAIDDPVMIYNNPDTADKIVKMMSLVTQKGGTATGAAIPGYHVAGKTGTSQKLVNRQYSHTQFFSSFVGFVPAEDPAFVLMVTADEPKGSYYGGVVAAPFFKTIALRTLRYLDVKPDPKLLEEAEAESKNKNKDVPLRD